ncbi:NEDD8-activating enzyme E1 regulatory subunit AXL [Porphyridium purpureum]|uniref:NEDD8-activating enzyme E1 regulatory subunit AXL n=1 Tax=Porphyridium purpureum TaxID=35688 RepID=A0A5J4YN25_PORPP|nr:NEDD8-activating enzyme E1 regulatory subunit AXL [Porphyridium purpureum]|eukprot:POR2685..scf295_9
MSQLRGSDESVSGDAACLEEKEKTRSKMAQPSSAGRYDRQLRVWGERGQELVERARICLIGSSATGTETIKNLVLPGVGAVQVMDTQSPSCGLRSHGCYGATDASHTGATHSTADADTTQICAARDLGSNFFVTEDDVRHGRPRAVAVAHWLQELNDAVVCTAEHISLDELLEKLDADNERGKSGVEMWVAQFSVLVVAQMPFSERAPLRRLAAACWSARVPLVWCRSYGHYGMVRVIDREILTYSGGGGEGADARQPLDASVTGSASPELWPELHAFYDSFDFAALDSAATRLVPYPVILSKALHEWREKHNGGEDHHAFPNLRKHRTELQQILDGWRKSPQCDEENFDEAMRKLRLICDVRPGELQHGLAPLVADAEHMCGICGEEQEVCGGSGSGTGRDVSGLKNIHSQPPEAAMHRMRSRAHYWLFLRCVRAFVDQFGDVPVTAALPDMVSDTESYVALQRIFHARARLDVERMTALMRQQQIKDSARCSRMRLLPASARERLLVEPDAEQHVAYLCKSLRGFRATRTRAPDDTRYGRHPEDSELVAQSNNSGGGTGGEKDDGVEFAVCALLFAADAFHELQGRFPGQPPLRALPVDASDDQQVAFFSEQLVEEDCALFRGVAQSVAAQMALSPQGVALDGNLIKEFVRCGAAELHTVASVVGGVAAQEAVKLLTGQFQPLNNTFIFDGVRGASASFIA